MQYNVFGSKHRSNVQGNEENSVNIATVKCLLLNSETGEFPDFVDLIFFFGIKNVRVDRKHTYIFFALVLKSVLILKYCWSWHWKHQSINTYFQGFGDILNLVPLAENVIKLTAVCMDCNNEGSFTKRRGQETAVRTIL